jgi:hypothetical protein
MIKTIINKINKHKQLVLDFHILQEEVDTLEENALYYHECLYNMDICTELVEELYNELKKINIDNEKIDEYLLVNFNFKLFDTTIIWGYM